MSSFRLPKQTGVAFDSNAPSFHMEVKCQDTSQRRQLKNINSS